MDDCKLVEFDFLELDPANGDPRHPIIIPSGHVMIHPEQVRIIVDRSARGGSGFCTIRTACGNIFPVAGSARDARKKLWAQGWEGDVSEEA